MSFRQKVNIVTIALIFLVLFLSRHELVIAWQTLTKVNIGIFLLILPLQFLSYFAAGAITFSYLRGKGDLKNVSAIESARMALELNFVNHILPTGGVSGASYMTWRLSNLGVGSGRATLAQVVRFAMTFGTFVVLLLLAVLLVTIDGGINRLIILVSSGLVTLIIVATLVVGYVIGSMKRLDAFSQWLYRVINGAWHKILRQKSELVSHKTIKKFFIDLHEDYLSLREEPQQLKRPFIWGFVFNIAETLIFFIAFLSLGVVLNPATIFIAIGVATLIGIFLPTPGGLGGYEAAMIFFLTTAGISAGVAVAAVLLTRVVLILITILSGYFFYHQALQKYGKHTT